MWVVRRGKWIAAALGRTLGDTPEVRTQARAHVIHDAAWIITANPRNLRNLWLPFPAVLRTLSPRVVREDDRAGSVEHAANAVRDARPQIRQLRRRLASELPHRLLQCEHAVHARVRVAEAAAVC